MWGKMKKASADISAKTVVSSRNTKEAISIQKKQNMILERKKNFGVEYLDLVERDATPEELEACVGRAMDAIAEMRGKVAKYKERIATNEAKLDLKLSTTPKNTQPSITVTSEEEEAKEEEKTTEASEAKEKSVATATATAVPAADEDLKTPVVAAIPINESGPNPFGDDDEEEVKKPASTNPFGDDDEEEEDSKKQSAPASTNLFGDDDDEEEEGMKKPASTNPFGDDDDDEPPPVVEKSGSANPFDDDDEPPKAPESSNPFDDDDGDDVAAKPSRSASSNPFDDD